MSEQLKSAALSYHATPVPGKLAMAITKPCRNQGDLALAYTPGVAAPVHAIVENPDAVYEYTAKSNLVAVITDGSAVLGLGNFYIFGTENGCLFIIKVSSSSGLNQ